MEYGKIYHRAALNDCYALNAQELEVSILTGYDVEKVFLCYGDPFSSGIMGGAERWSGEKEEMTDYVRLAEQKRYSIVIRPEYKRCKYYFELHGGNEVIYYLENGFVDERRMTLPGRKEQCFFFPWMNPADVNVTPDWVKDTVWYQIFPERFCNGDKENDSCYVKPWKCEKVHHLDRYGGDLRGIREKIPYLKDLGITGIYLTPIFMSPSNHKYNTTDYYKIDPEFGNDEEMQLLVKELHEAGIRLMIDAVFNHCGEEFAPWKDVMKNGRNSRYFDWFFIEQFPFNTQTKDTRDKRYASFAFHGGMPKLNTNNPEVVTYFKELCTYWIEKWDIDGIRFDVGNEVSHYFLKELRKACKSAKSDIYLLGEIWHDSITWLMGDEYDSVMNYPFEQSINDFYVDDTRTAEDFEHDMNRCYSLYMKQTNQVLFNLLDSHDTERLAMRTKTEGAFFQQLAILFTMPGTPCIYYGTEIRMPGGYDPDCRRCMPWEEIESGKYQETIEKVKQLIALRKNVAMSAGDSVQWVQDEKMSRVIHYVKKGPSGENLHVLLNGESRDILLAACGIQENQEMLFSYGLKEEKILAEGVCIWIEA